MSTAVVEKPKKIAKVKAAPKPVEIDAQRAADLLRLGADATRARILLILKERGEEHVGAICERLAQSQPATSHHLALLRASGVVACRRGGKHNFYKLTGRGEVLADALRFVGEE